MTAITGAVTGAVPVTGTPGIAPCTEMESGSAGAVEGSAASVWPAVAVFGGRAGSLCPHSLQNRLRSTLRAPQVGQGFKRIHLGP